MRVLSADQPHSQLMVTRQPCGCPDGVIQPRHDPAVTHQMVKRIHTASYPFPYIGERVAIYATKRRAHGGLKLGDYQVSVLRDILWYRREVSDHPILMPLGAIVGSCVITASLPIVDRYAPRQDASYILAEPDGLHLIRLDPEWPSKNDISDQLPFGHFTPGMHAWILEEAAPTTARCPWCWGSGKNHFDPQYESRFDADCLVCSGAGRCPPIPFTHPGGRHPEWTAT